MKSRARYLIAICTRGTEKNLPLLCEKLVQLTSNVNVVVDIYVIVNSENISLKLNPKIKIVSESKTGYSSVRNRALALCGENTNLIFIDDDEIPSDDWLVNMIQANTLFPNALIVGPVLPLSHNELSLSLLYSDSQKQISGNNFRPVKKGGAGNMLVPSKIVGDAAGYFDLDFNSGGEDTDFCMRLSIKNFEIISQQKAVVHEIVDEVRLNPQWIRLRYLNDTLNYEKAFVQNYGIGKKLKRIVTHILKIFFCICLLLFGRESRQILGLKLFSRFRLLTFTIQKLNVRKK